MRGILIFLFILFLQTISFGQANSESAPKPKTQEKTITQHQFSDLSLAKQGFRPKLTLQHALKLAESYIEKEKIDISEFYLYEAKYILYGSKDKKEPCWFFWWVNESGALGNYVEIVVSIETENVTRLPSM